jgi:hypothetical protein
MNDLEIDYKLTMHREMKESETEVHSSTTRCFGVQHVAWTLLTARRLHMRDDSWSCQHIKLSAGAMRSADPLDGSHVRRATRPPHSRFAEERRLGRLCRCAGAACLRVYELRLLLRVVDMEGQWCGGVAETASTPLTSPRAIRESGDGSFNRKVDGADHACAVRRVSVRGGDGLLRTCGRKRVDG